MSTTRKYGGCHQDDALKPPTAALYMVDATIHTIEHYKTNCGCLSSKIFENEEDIRQLVKLEG